MIKNKNKRNMSEINELPSMMLSFGLSTLAGGLIGLLIFKKFFKGQAHKNMSPEDAELKDWEIVSED